VLANARRLNPTAKIIMGVSEVTADDPSKVTGKAVLCIDDGPTLTHGEMPFGAGKIACDKYKAGKIVDPRPYAKGSLNEILQKWRHLEWAGSGLTLPAMGYYDEQLRDLKESIEATPCDAVLVATPIDLNRLLKLNKPVVQVAYELVDGEGLKLREPVNAWIASLKH